jgi:hypothetical protein
MAQLVGGSPGAAFKIMHLMAQRLTTNVFSPLAATRQPSIAQGKVSAANVALGS